MKKSLIRDYKGTTPKVEKNVFLAENSALIGDCTIGEDSSIWYGAVLRADVAPITIGKRSNVQDNTTVHTYFDGPVVIGDDVTIGHNCVIHGCTIKDKALIGMGATVLDGAIIEEGAIVGANALVKAGQVVPKNTLAVGNPLVIKGEVKESTAKATLDNCNSYVDLKDEYLK